MKKLLLLSLFSIAACQQAVLPPTSFVDLLEIVDSTDDQICKLPLAELRKTMTPEALDAAKIDAFNFSDVIESYADNPADTLNAGEGIPTTLKSFHDDLHYWMDRISEQSQYGDQDSKDFNLRFCVMNEKRADLHAASRTDILARLKDGITLPAPELIENINHETSFDDGFTAKMMAKIFTPENMESLTSLERAQMRGGESLLVSDPKTAEAFWKLRDEEISAVITFIQTHTFSTTADKLDHMTDIDQSLRRLWGRANAEKHFESEAEYEAFKANISSRVVKVDEFNTSELKKMLEGRGWFRDDLDGGGAANDAWLIAQHADRNPDFQVKALRLIESELGAPGVSKSNYAYLYDRVQMRMVDGIDIAKRVQRYGTQGRCTGPGTWEPFTVEAPDRIDEIRAEMNLGTMAEYQARFKDICKTDQR